MIGTRATIALALIALVLGLWAGYEWRHGRDGIAEAAQLKQQQAADRAYIDELKAVVNDVRQQHADAVADYHAAEQRLDAIAAQLEQEREDIRQFRDRQQQQLDAIAAARPDLRDLHLGADVLQHWRESNAGLANGAAGDPATAAPAAGQPAGAVPATPAADQRRGARAVGEPRRGGGALPRLQSTQRIAAAGACGMAGHGVVLVLQGGGCRRPAGFRMRG